MGSDFYVVSVVDIVAGKNKFLIFMETQPHCINGRTAKQKRERKKKENYVYLNDFLSFHLK